MVTALFRDIRFIFNLFTNSDTGYIVGYNGTILKTSNGGGVGINEIQVSSNLLKIYPNPSSDNISIETSGITEGSVVAIANLDAFQELIIRRMMNHIKLTFAACPEGYILCG